MKIQILAEGGGIGDLLQHIGVIRSIKVAIPDAVTWLFTSLSRVEWAVMDRITDMVVAVPDESRRGLNQLPDPVTFPYLETGAPFDVTIDLYDPAETYENSSFGLITRGRAELWRDTAASLLASTLTPQLAQLPFSAQAYTLATAQLQNKVGRHLSFVVGIHPLACWPWRSLSFDQARELVQQLQRYGAQCVLFHHKTDPILAWAEELHVAAAIGEKATVLTEMVRLCDAMIAVDSGLFHLAGTLHVPTIGLFAQTDGETTAREYSSCSWITAGPLERAGLTCAWPCYRRELHGCNRPMCERTCRALQRIKPKPAVDMAIKLIREHKGSHLPTAARSRRLFSKYYQ